MADFTEEAALAKELINENGRSVTLILAGDSPLETAKPHRGQSVPHRASVTGIAVFSVNSVFTERDGDRRGIQYALFAADDDQGYDLEVFNEMHDGDVEWRIMDVQVLDPGEPRILYEFRVER